MGSLLEHKPIHDLYLYGSTYYVDPTNYSNNKTAFPLSYNPNCWIKDPQYDLPSADFSGITIRSRGAPPYGFDDLSSVPNVQSSGVVVGFTGSRDEGGALGGSLRFDPLTGITYLYPALGFFRSTNYLGGTYNPDPNTLDYSLTNLSYYYPGRPIANLDIAKDWKNWNCGYPCSVLISPRHAITTAHFIAGQYGSPATLTFLGKNNVYYTKTAKLVYLNSSLSGFFNPPGYDLGDGPDLGMYELDTPFTTAELQQVKVYKILDQGSLRGPVSPIYQPGYGIDCVMYWLWNQGFVTITKGLANPYFDLDQYPDAPQLGGTIYNDGIPGPSRNNIAAGIFNRTDGSGSTYTIDPKSPSNLDLPPNAVFSGRLKFAYPASAVWVGDSGTPRLVYVPTINETCYYDCEFGVGGYVGSEWYPENNQLGFGNEKFWFKLRDYIAENTNPSYTIQFVKYSNVVPPRPKYKQTIHVNGITYYARFETPVYQYSGGNTGPVDLSLYLTPGLTYSFAVAALSKSGTVISQPVTLNNVNFPPAKPAEFPNVIP